MDWKINIVKMVIFPKGWEGGRWKGQEEGREERRKEGNNSHNGRKYFQITYLIKFCIQNI
jgi:hypothetical protein